MISSSLKPAVLREEITALGPWFHNLHLPDGSQTAPDHVLGDFPAFKWAQIAPAIPADLRGWKVLDIGCNAGYYSFQLAQRGARVLAIDIDSHYLRQARWAAGQFGLQDCIEFREMPVYELAREGGTYDLVWFMGVLYHLRYPLLALDIVRQKVGRLMVLQTLTMPGEAVYAPPPDFPLAERGLMNEPGWPAMAFIEHRLAGDPTNWWAPNHACVEAMLRSSGFHIRRRLGHEIYLCVPGENSSLQSMEPFIASELKAATGRDNRPFVPVKR